MIRNKRFFRALLLALLCGTASQLHAGTADTDPAAARDVVNRFMDALSQGDTATVKELLGGQMLVRKERLLANPNYSWELQKAYSGAQFSVGDPTELDSGGVSVDVTLSIPGSEAEKMTFILRQGGESDSYRIYEER